MKDIDFDELDRAVTSLLGKPSDDAQPSNATAPAATPAQESTPMPSVGARGAAPSNTPQSTARQNPSNAAQEGVAGPPSKELHSTPQPAVQQESTLPSSAEEPAESQQPTPSPAPATLPISPQHPTPTPMPTRPAVAKPAPPPRTGARFMDVVHPTTAARSLAQPPAKSSPPAPVAKPSEAGSQDTVRSTNDSARRETPSLEKTASTSPVAPREAEQSSAEQPALSPTYQRVSRVGKTITTPATAKSNTFMDKLVPRRQQSHNDSDEPLLTEHAGRPADEKQKRLEGEEVPSLFLPNTKVEKRPLGGKSSERDRDSLDQPPKATPQLADTAPPEELTTAVESSGTEAPTPLPPELDQKLVAVEAAEPEADRERPDTPMAYPQERKPEPKKPVAPTSTREAGKMAASASIPPQYRTKTAAPDTTPRSIYDTEEYHAPLPAVAPTKKKKHPVVWVLLVVLLLALGAGLGAVVYFVLG